MMWIRTQDRKEIVKLNDIFYELNNAYNLIAGYDYHDKPTPLGTYATEKRALEVLDEIQQAIIGKIIIPISISEHNFENTSAIDVIKCNSKIESLPIVYEMPKE